MLRGRRRMTSRRVKLGVIESGGQSSGFLIVILIFFLISPSTDGIMIKNKIKIKNQKLTTTSSRTRCNIRAGLLEKLDMDPRDHLGCRSASLPANVPRAKRSRPSRTGGTKRKA